jgi:RNA polymerase sigma-70 factor (ECF subfamily)
LPTSLLILSDEGPLDPRGGGHDVQVELVRRAQRGDEEAFAALVPGTATRLLGVAYRILRDAALAEDATQQALLVAWRKLPTLREPERFEAWTYRLVVNACYAETSRRRSLLPLRLVPNDGAVVDTTSQTVDRVRLETAFSRLSVAHRTVVVLHLHVGLPFDEIASTLDIPIGTARSRLHYAVRALRLAIGTDDDQTAERGTA